MSRSVPFPEAGDGATPGILRLSVPAQFASLRTMSTALRLFARRQVPDKAGGEEVHELRLAAQEACTNTIEHSIKQNPTARLLITIFQIDGGLALEIQDEGPPFNPRSPLAGPPDPAALAEGGYGLFLINTLVDEIHYRSHDGLNTLTLVKRWKGVNAAA